MRKLITHILTSRAAKRGCTFNAPLNYRHYFAERLAMRLLAHCQKGTLLRNLDSGLAVRVEEAK